MVETGQGLQIVSVTKDHKYVLEERELEQLLLHEDVKDLPVVVVGVAGAYRGGKSFLLNFFLRYLSSPSSARRDGSWLGEDSEPLAGFKWRGGIKATTMGILMWSQPFITTLPSGDKVAVLLVDTQGTFDSKSTVRDNSTVFALSTLVSSVQIYNLSQNIKEDDLQHLELFTEYGKLVHANNSNSKAFQVLEFLVRDWQFPDDYPYGTIGGESLLQEKLEITPDLAKEMKELREHIRSSFGKVSCFLMPHPGFEVLDPKFNGNISDIDADFRTQLIDLVNSIFGPDKLLPKTINGEKIKARDLFNYFKSYMELFNSDKIPTPGNILEMTVKAGLLSAIGEARDIYEKGMDSECGPKQLSVPPGDLVVLHQKYVKLATEFFNNKKKMGSKKEADKYLKKLTKELGERLPQFLQSNLSRIQTAINKAKDSYDEAIQNISKDQQLCVHAKDLEEVHRAGVDAALKTYDAARKRITKAYDDDRAKFIQSFENQYALLRQRNEQNNNMLSYELTMNYRQLMQSKATLNPPLTAIEFKKAHEDALNKALDAFEKKRNIHKQWTEDSYKFNMVKDINDYFIQLKVMNKSNNREAMKAGLVEYDNYINNHWDQTSVCLHPDDLEELHRLGTCHAFEIFHPQKQCSDGFDDNDEDESSMKTTLSHRFEGLKKKNDDANNTAIRYAYNEYVTSMDNNCRFSLWWLLVIPYIVHLNNRDSYHEAAKNIANAVFYGKRQASGYHSSDPYKNRLDEMIQQYYQNTYK